MTQETEDQDKIPFRIRFKAWWEGVEPESLLEHGAISSDPNSIAVSDPDAEGEEAVHWNETRIEMAGRIWGTEEEPDVVLPGGVDYTLSLAKPMGLNAEKTVLDLCAGLGGGTRAMSKEFSLWIEGMEANPQLAAKAAFLSHKAGMEKKAPVAHFDPEAFTLKKQRYDAILVRESLFSFNNKKRILEVLFEALKPRGHLIITDYVYKQADSEDNKIVEAWGKHYYGEARPWTLNDYKRAIVDLSMDLHIHEERTDEYRQLVLNGWSAFVGGLKKEDMNREFVNLLMYEAQYWLYLTRSFESGELLYMRLHATRGGESI